MTQITTEMLLSMGIIALTILAIIVFIVYGAGSAFYGIFVIAVLLMFYTWYRISGLQAQTPMIAKVSYSRKTKNTSTKKRSRRRSA
jgi:hypothetical protein